MNRTLTKIYALRENGFVRYVGKTKHSLESRLAGHLEGARRGECTYKATWIRSMLRRGDVPSITLITEIEKDGNGAERAWIKYFRDHGVKLTNGTDGGDGNSNPSKEVREKISKANKGRKLSLQTRINIGLGHKGLRYPPRTAEQRLRMSIANKKHPPITEETRKKLSIAHKGRKRGPMPEAQKAKISASKKGHTFSSEIKAKWSAQRMGHIVSSETRAKISAAKVNPSEEVRERMRAGWKIRKATVGYRRKLK